MAIKIIIILLIVSAFFIGGDALAGAIIKGPAYLGLTHGLVGCWNFDGSYNKVPDCSGNNNTGTLTGGPTKIQGKIGQALSFDGVDDYVNLGDPSSGILDFGTTTEFTLNAWAKIPTGSSGVIINKIDFNGDTGGYQLSVDDATGKISVTLNGSGGASLCVIETSSGLPNRNWHFISAVVLRRASCTTGDILIYVDGQLYPSTATLGTLNTNGNISSTEVLKVSADRSSGVLRYSTNNVDEVRIYNRRLSEAEIQRLYRIGLGSTTNRSSVNNSLNQGLVGCWTFDGAYTKVPDCSGNNRTGTLTNGPVKVNGKTGQALSFDGDNDRVSLNTLDPGTVHTVAFWANVNNGSHIIIGNLNDSSQAVRIMGTLLDYTAGGESVDADVGNIIDSWHYFVITRNGTSVRFYKNASFLRTQTLSSNFAVEWDSIGLNPAFKLNGILDDLKIYNRVLSESEILRLYRTGVGSTADRSNTDSLKHGLVGCWTFDGAYNKVPDCSGRNNTGTITQAVKVKGKIGQALDFDGVNDDVAIPNQAIGPSSFTFSAWVYFRSTGTGSKTVFDRGGFGFYIDADDDNFAYWNNQAAGSGTFTAVTPNKWQHILYTYDGTNIRGYLNGVLVGSPVASTINSGAGTAAIGELSDGGEAFPGIIDEVRFYNRVLTSAEISRLYQLGL